MNLWFEWLNEEGFFFFFFSFLFAFGFVDTASDSMLLMSTIITRIETKRLSCHTRLLIYRIQ